MNFRQIEAKDLKTRDVMSNLGKVINAKKQRSDGSNAREVCVSFQRLESFSFDTVIFKPNDLVVIEENTL